MTTRITFFADVILPLPIPNTFTYRVPLELNDSIEIGKRVIVQFGKKKLYSGIIANIHQTPPKDYQAKYVDSILDEAPIVHSSQLKFWEWISEYYICNIGEVMNAALPTGLKLVSKTKIILNESIEIDWKILSDKEHLILEALEINNILELSEVESILDLKSGYSIIKSLLEKNYIVVAEQVQEKYKPKLEKIIQLPKDFGEEQIKKIFEELERAPKQLEAFMMFVHLTNHSSQIGKKKLIREANTNSATIKQLVDKGFLEQTTKEESRIASKNKEEEIDSLTPIQTDSLEKINTLFQEKRTVLLHGVTGSGKTEVYIQLIKEQIDKGNQVLYLLPEIALTTQIISRLRKKFGDKVGVYHSKYNSNERVEVWNEMLKGKESRFQIIIGARSALFLPFQGLGFVIVDEEHDSSYKQNDTAPRYQGRDSAIY